MRASVASRNTPGTDAFLPRSLAWRAINKINPIRAIMPTQTLAENAIGFFDGFPMIKHEAKVISETAPREAQAERPSAANAVGSEQLFFTAWEKISAKRLQNAVGIPKSISNPYTLFIISRI